MWWLQEGLLLFACESFDRWCRTIRLKGANRVTVLTRPGFSVAATGDRCLLATCHLLRAKRPPVCGRAGILGPTQRVCSSRIVKADRAGPVHMLAQACC
jgi:hypothetical protein